MLRSHHHATGLRIKFRYWSSILYKVYFQKKKYWPYHCYKISQTLSHEGQTVEYDSSMNRKGPHKPCTRSKRDRPAGPQQKACEASTLLLALRITDKCSLGVVVHGPFPSAQERRAQAAHRFHAPKTMRNLLDQQIRYLSRPVSNSLSDYCSTSTSPFSLLLHLYAHTAVPLRFL